MENMQKNKNPHQEHGYQGEGHEEHTIKAWKLVLSLVMLVFGLTTIWVVEPVYVTVWSQFILATLAVTVIGIDFYIPTWKSLKQGKLSADLLFTLAMILAYTYSTVMFFIALSAGTIDHEFVHTIFFEAVLSIGSIFYFGRWIEEKLAHRVTKDIENLMALLPEKAIKIENDKEIEVNAVDLKVGDIVLVKTGQKIPADGIVIKGETNVDESAFSGESLPVHKRENSNVFCGTIAANGYIYVKVTANVKDSSVAKIIAAVQDASASKPKTQKIADKVSQYFIPFVFILGLTAFAIWGGLTWNWYAALSVLIATFVIACPCSFGITTPMNVLVSSKMSLRKGILFASKDIFEKGSNIDGICLDKTGTLTEGKITLVNHTLNKEMLDLVIAAEKKSNHPIALSIASIETNNILDVNVKESAGKGLDIEYKGHKYHLGSLKYLLTLIPNYVESEEITKKREEGSIIIYLFDNNVIGHLELKDSIKKDAYAFVKKLNKRKIEIYMLTGDNKLTALAIAKELGIKPENVYSEVLPIQKSEIVKQLSENGKKIAFVGDGINDAVALSAAYIGIAMGSGSAIAIDSADIVIQKNELKLITEALDLSDVTLSSIYIGFAIAILYNLTVLPLAMLGFVDPGIAAALMVMSDSMAVFNAMLFGATANWRIKLHSKRKENETKK